MASRNAPKIIAIGLDSADPDLLVRWSDADALPNLAALRAQGVWGPLETPQGLADDAVWPSFSTCMSPARHGRYHFKATLPGSYDAPRFRDHHFRRTPFWASLSDAGKRVAILDVPKSPRASRINGVLLTDWRVHGRDDKTRSMPALLAGTLLGRFGEDRTDRPGSGEFLCNTALPNEQMRDDFMERLKRSIHDKTTLAEELLARESWDLLLVVFKESHCAGHQCWPPGPDLREIYATLDSSIGRLLHFAGRETTVLVFSNLGMGANHTGNHLLDEILRRLERRCLSRRDNARIAADIFYHRARNRLGRPAATSRHRLRCAFALDHNEVSGAIRVNLAGREPDGRIQSGAELAALLRFLEAELCALIDPATGRRIVDKVIRTADRFEGENAHHLPDLLVVWAREQPITAATSATIGTVTALLPDYRPGNHIPGGIYFACGPGIHADPAPHPASIVDIGPTIAKLLGTQLPGVDGQPIPVVGG